MGDGEVVVEGGQAGVRCKYASDVVAIGRGGEKSNSYEGEHKSGSDKPCLLLHFGGVRENVKSFRFRKGSKGKGEWCVCL